jgi:hypothetical protein
MIRGLLWRRWWEGEGVEIVAVDRLVLRVFGQSVERSLEKAAVLFENVVCVREWVALNVGGCVDM